MKLQARKRKVVFSWSFAYYQKQHESYEDRSMIGKATSTTTGHQITLLEKIILSASKYNPPKQHVMKWRKGDRLAKSDLWLTPEEEVDEINNKLQTPQRATILRALAFNM